MKIYVYLDESGSIHKIVIRYLTYNYMYVKIFIVRPRDGS